MQPTGQQLELHVNGWLQDVFGGRPGAATLPRRARGAAHAVTVPSKYLEDDEEHLDDAASGVTRATMSALQKQMRAAGFKGALVYGYGVGAGRSGFVVKYQGKDYYFSIDEDPHQGHTVESRQARRLMHGDNMQRNGLRGRNTINVKADPDADNCLAEAVREFVAEYPDLRGWDLNPQWADDDNREEVTLTLPAWFDVEARRAARGIVRNGRHEPNGPRTGILSDGTRVNVYRTPNEYSAVPHNEYWDRMESGGTRYVLAIAPDASNSFWLPQQENKKLGQGVPWSATPDNIKRHIEQRVAQETMVANGRKKKRLYVGDLKTRPIRSGTAGAVALALECPGCGEQFSADPSDYFLMGPKEPFKCMHCGEYLELADRRAPRGPEPQEARHTPGNAAWDRAEDKGLVRIVVEDEQENYFDVYGEPDTAEEREEIIDQINRDGLNHFASQYRKRARDPWETADSIGMVIGDLADSGYEDSLKQAALGALVGKHTPNARGSVANEISARELSLYIENEYALVGAPNSIGKSIHNNLTRKVASGKYDKALAPKAWLHLIDEGARRYSKEYGDGKGFGTFTAADRRQVAEEFARAWEQENLPR